jgi:DNA-binding PadR family transcriptional regulator
MSVRNALLGLLAQSPRHGYELHAAFEALVGGEQVWDVKPAQIYTTLTRLEESGMVAQDNHGEEVPTRRVYTLTETGRNELLDWLTSTLEPAYEHDAFFLKLMISLATGVVSPSKVIQAQRSRLFQEMHDMTIRKQQLHPRTELPQIILLDKAIMHVEADLRWLEMTEARLDEMRRHPPPAPELRPRGRPRGKG